MTDIVPAPAHRPADLALTDRLAVLDAAAAEYARPIRNTEQAYAADWRAWLRFLEDLNSTLAEEDPHGTPVPPTITNVGAFVAFIAWHERAALAPATAERRLYGVIMTLRQRYGIEVPKQTIGAARQTLTNYRRELAETNTPRGRGQAPAATVPDLRRICAAMPPNLAGHRDRAIVLLGFAIAARRSNLAALDVTDVAEHDEGLAVTIRYGKTGAREAAVDRGTNPGTCPVRAVRKWIDTAGLTDGPLFRPIDRHGNLSTARMSPRACGEVVTRRAGQAEGVPYRTGHSLRAGLATEARKAGHDVKTIADQGGWNPTSAELYKYLRIVDRWADNATKGIGL
ncbi:site-specific integrase [Nocardia sp. alder85J]|uniref:site-specific integrase n=1 Tax=Nocardia sp. alder85J TaxID=2862949 RepID=UPI001CD4A77F|nr:site-specific integrase [Nocardia sp. alder85J]MCX4099135.1 site-specific integrase [Nocardia sp. alder85J]